ncbi:hypothetical protein GLAREA_12064 [Glarea lozoyensis ATCC 20868]|uniref:DUF1996 domain-containing protein n=1 Tax=Glarea lozoyensis (strain ATCC 20868 / MF5171) TaxID=1116229 RepID=S3D0C6_GLAL2|nr:uncharacterized protein GLAREA_12064 [Glarea lozoyensis ATCC 20868]EPE31982.1 hypothetical protein GLAREA_12064 [Glarea lozoyensis ATCC 20868]
MHLLSPITIALLAQSTHAAQTVLRFGCSQIVVERLDPYVTTLEEKTTVIDLPSDLLIQESIPPLTFIKQITGGNAFSPQIPQSDVSALANCTTCSFSEDLSNYWTANLYFRAPNGTYKRVPQIPNRYLDGSVGGMTIYYTSPYDGSKVTAFKPCGVTNESVSRGD